MTHDAPTLTDATEGARDHNRPPAAAKLRFDANRNGFFRLLFVGLVAYVPTLGLNRFWLLTAKRRFYWEHTLIAGDPLEYTGTPKQLLIGFLMAVLIFAPLYLLLLIASLNSADFIIAGYGVIAVLFYFLMGYAGYRAQRFRLSRTLWRGIRFQLGGNPWAYAWRRFLWTLATLATAGLAYPFQTASLWRYRLNNIWLGDRKFEANPRWTQIAGPFYVGWALMAGLVGYAVFRVETAQTRAAESGAILLASLVALPLLYYFYIHVTGRSLGRFLSTLRLGAAQLGVNLKVRSLLVQHLAFWFLFLLAVCLFGILGFALYGWASSSASSQLGPHPMGELGALRQLGWGALVGIAGLYFGFIAAWTLIANTVLHFGLWRLVAENAFVTGVETLSTIRAAGSESPIAGEGLADALNVGAY